jgi:hypothetical protein
VLNPSRLKAACTRRQRRIEEEDGLMADKTAYWFYVYAKWYGRFYVEVSG